MRRFTGLSWRRRSLVAAVLALTSALTFSVAGAFADAGNPIANTIQATVLSSTPTTVTIGVKGEWNWLSHSADCNYDRAATGAGILWGDRSGADNSRTITSIARNSNVVTVTMPAHTWKVGERVMIAGVTNASFNGGPFAITAVSGTTIKYSQTAANATSSGGKAYDIDVYNGWLVYKSATSNGYIGTKVTTAQNPIDREVHPTDVGNVPADGHGPLPGANTSNGAPVNQTIFDPAPNATTGLSNNYLTWRGGCGREPVFASSIPITSATEGGATGKVVTLTLGAPGNASINVGDSITVAGVTPTGYNGTFTVTATPGANQVQYTSGKTGLAAGSGGTVTDNTPGGTNQSGPGCIEWCGDPWGSWGYQTISGYPSAYTHTYQKTIPDPSDPTKTISGLPDKICVNFYDVHGGGTTASTFQVVSGASEVQVDGNGDNSISTNDFNVLQGQNCTGLSLSTHDASNANTGGTIHDIANIFAPPITLGSITFKAYGPHPTPDCTEPAAFTAGPVNITGSGDYQSPEVGPVNSPGNYYWRAFYSGDPSHGVPAASTACGDPGETSVVTTVATPGLTLAKTANPTTYSQVGQVIGYTYLVTNSGNTTFAGPVTVTDNKVTVTCPDVPVGGLTPGSSITCHATPGYSIKQSDIDSGSVTNTATAHSNGTDSNTDQATVTANQTKSIHLDKTATLDMTVVAPSNRADAGDKINYGFKITNTGNVTLSSVDLLDALVGKDPAVACGATSLAPGADTTCTASYTITQADVGAGTVHNFATACGSPPTGSRVCDDDTTDTPLPADKSILLVKTATLHMDVVAPDTRVDAGDTIGYGFKITNTGNVTLSSVDLLDALVGKDPAVACGATTLAPGADTTCTATYTIKQSDIDAGTVHNFATACGSPPTGSRVCDDDTTDTPLPADKSILLVKTATLHMDVVAPDTRVDAGDTIGYGFKITNTGNVTLSSVDLLDALVGKDPAVACGATTLAPGADTTCTATYTIKQSDIDAGTVHNFATACGSPPTGSRVCDDDTTDTPLPADKSILLVKTATLHMDVVAPDTRVDAGDTIGYGFKITNTGNVTLSSVDLLDALVGKDPAVACGATTLAPGADTTCTATYTIKQSDIDAGTVHNFATACGSPPTGSRVCDDDTTDTPLPADKSILLVKTATLHMDVVAPDTRVDAGDTIGYGFKITNTGNVTLSSVDLLDALVGKDPAVACGATTLAPGADTTCTATYTIKQSDIDAGTVHNFATACGSPPTGSRVCDDDTTDTPLPADKSILLVKTATLHMDVVAPDTRVDAGDTIGYGFKITNTGNVTLSSVDLLDALVGKDPAVACGATTLAPGADTTCTATYTIKQSDIDAGTVHNFATACGSPPTGSRVCDDDTTDTPLPADKSILLVKTATLHMDVVAPDTRVDAGDTIGYGFKITNTGNVTLSSVDLLDALVGKDPAVACGATTLAPGADTTCTATYTIKQSDIDAGTVHNFATACGSPPTGSRVCDDDTTDTPLPADKSIHLDKTASPKTYSTVGAVIAYSYLVTNTGNVTLAGPVTVSDDKVTVTCPAVPVGGLTPGSSITCHATPGYSITQADIDAGSVTNTATAHSNGIDSNQDKEVVTANQAPALSLEKTATPLSYVLGTVISYSYLVTNTGNTTFAGPVTVSDDKVNVTCPPVPAGGLAPTMSITCHSDPGYTATLTDIINGSITNTATAHSNGTDSNTDHATVTAQTITTEQNFVPNDTAMLGGLAPGATGTVTFKLYKTADCSGSAIYTEPPATVTGNGSYQTNNSVDLKTLLGGAGTGGTYSWQVTYSGDANNPANGSCAEHFTVTNG